MGQPKKSLKDSSKHIILLNNFIIIFKKYVKYLLLIETLILFSDIKSEVKLASPPKSPPKSPVSPVVSAPLMPSASNEYISRVLSKFANGNSGKTSPKRPAPDSSRSILTQSIPSLLNPAISQSGSSPLKNSHLNLDMLNYPVPGGFPGVSASQLSPNQTPLITSNNNNNQIGQNQTRKITELELELTQARLKIVEFQRYMQFVQARLILSDRATEEKNNLIKQKDKTIEQLRLELDRREQIFRAYGIGKSVTSGSGENSASGGVLDSPKALARKSPKSAGSSVGSNSSKGSNSGSDASQPTPSGQPTPVPASIPVPVPVPGPSWK